MAIENHLFDLFHYKLCCFLNTRNKVRRWKGYSYAQFYQVLNSDFLENKKGLFDPNDRLDLKHYLIIGYDSYLEVIASMYEIRCL